jgi:hypothetical protein
MIIVQHASAAEAAAVERWCTEGAHDLGVPELDVTVTIVGSGIAPSSGTEAWSNEHGITFDRSIFRGGDDRVGWILLEELAHVVLGREGVPHEGVAVFYQELFATWFQFASLVGKGRLDLSRIRTWPITDQEAHHSVRLPYHLGKHLGAALAGSVANQQHLDRWLTAPTDEVWRRRTIAAQQELTPPLTADAVAESYRANA